MGVVGVRFSDTQNRHEAFASDVLLVLLVNVSELLHLKKESSLIEGSILDRRLLPD